MPSSESRTKLALKKLAADKILETVSLLEGIGDVPTTKRDHEENVVSKQSKFKEGAEFTSEQCETHVKAIELVAKRAEAKKNFRNA